VDGCQSGCSSIFYRLFWVGASVDYGGVGLLSYSYIVVFDCKCNTQNSLLLNQHNGDDAPQDYVRKVPMHNILQTNQQYLASCGAGV